ncbi:uncharacterized protein LOC135687634 isoform X2 [Rhopilema esculentum]|uniref:uncharacterized protein LOC135687634 isoform X2 n=1 Tax=Rhopilema esculentum TaxID=499914 RepID=UPI0031E3E21B
MAKHLSETYGDPPGHPGIDEIIDDIRKASMDDIVFKSSNTIKKNSDLENLSNLLNEERELLIQSPTEDNRKQLSPKITYEMATRFLEQNQNMRSLLKLLETNAGSLSSMKTEILAHLTKEDVKDN